MSSSAFDFQDLLQLVELIKSSSQFSEFKLRANGIELELRRGPVGELATVSAPAAMPAVPVPGPAAAGASTSPSEVHTTVQTAPEALAEGAAVTAPMVGTVYLAPEPGAAPFVCLGQRVEADTQVCIVEVMKLMNAIPAGHAGVVRQILVADAAAVEFGQPMFVISAS